MKAIEQWELRVIFLLLGYILVNLNNKSWRFLNVSTVDFSLEYECWIFIITFYFYNFLSLRYIITFT